MRTRLALAAGVLTLSMLAAQADAAEEPSASPLRWDPAWTHASAWDYTLTAVGVTSLLVETALFQNRAQAPRWSSPILLDNAVRGVFASSDPAVQSTAENASWGLWFLLVGYPLVVDVPYVWVRYGRTLAWDLFWQDATALSLSGAVDFALRDSVARVRPKNEICVEQGQTNCFTGPEVTRSFPSGHLSETTTATALICTQHLKMRLYGPPWDAVTCASAVAADVATASMKLVADDHWATDILAGAALGVAFGWGLPVLMHLRGSSDNRSASAMPLLIAPVPVTYERGGGIGVVAMF